MKTIVSHEKEITNIPQHTSLGIIMVTLRYFLYYTRVCVLDGFTQTEPKEDTTSRSFNTPVLIITRYSRSPLILPF